MRSGTKTTAKTSTLRVNLSQIIVAAALKRHSRMSSQKRGKSYETELSQDIYEETDHTLLPEPIGYSGNHNIPAPDIRIDDGTKIHAFELKRTTSDRISVTYDPTDRGKDDLHQLIQYAREYPRTVVPYVGVRFTQRQLLIAKLWLGAPNDEAVIRSATKTAPTDVRLTRAGNLSIHKPDTDEWPSARKGDDVQYLLETIGYR